MFFLYAFYNEVVDMIEKARFHIDEFHSGQELLNSGMHYDIILLDIDMPEMNGLDTARLLRQKDKNVKLIYITNYSDYTVIRQINTILYN